MNIKHIIQLFLAVCVIALTTSCGDTTTEEYEVTTQKDAQIYSFSLAQKYDSSIEDSTTRVRDSLACIALGKATFAIDQINNRIYNPTKLDYNLKLRKLYVTLGVNATYGAGKIEVSTPDSVYTWNSSDSIDFSKQPVYITIYAADTTSSKTYLIDVKSYKSDPDSIDWSQQNSLPAGIGISKTVYSALDDKFYTFASLLDNVTLYIADRNNLSWTNEALSGLPSNVNYDSFIVLNNKFYVITNDGASYTSIDGKTWSVASNGKHIAAIYGVLPTDGAATDLLLVAIKSENDYYYGKTTDLVNVEQIRTVESYFPITGYASVSNFSRNKTTNMLIIVGGTDATSSALPRTWIVKDMVGDIETSPYSNNSFFEGNGSSLLLYNNSLFVLQNKEIYSSLFWGSS
ncbi:MAG: DUF6242 domain-containing protein, partial [Dysgonomonas sp.]